MGVRNIKGRALLRALFLRFAMSEMAATAATTSSTARTTINKPRKLGVVRFAVEEDKKETTTTTPPPSNKRQKLNDDADDEDAADKDGSAASAAAAASVAQPTPAAAPRPNSYAPVHSFNKAVRRYVLTLGVRAKRDLFALMREPPGWHPESYFPAYGISVADFGVWQTTAPTARPNASSAAGAAATTKPGFGKKQQQPQQQQPSSEGQPGLLQQQQHG